ncbi:MAG: LysM peptidoglycan-binding domain-containing protein [Vicingus serpentipes]|nr:LysM peptidoglycan-binding domain-containing protein [Vicingus serpentipes]
MKIVNPIIRTVLIINFQLLIFNCFAQTDSLEIHQIKGKDYYIHIVEKGESLYAIHQKYGVPVEIIKAENPSVADGLSIGEKIFVPVNNNQSESNVDGNYLEHIVAKKETLYAISNLYKVNQNEIIIANPSITEGLKEGEIIKIPIKGIQKEVVDKPVNVQSKYPTHLVQPGETLYALSKLYAISIAIIEEANDGLKGGLKVGETIRIPIVMDQNETAINGEGLTSKQTLKSLITSLDTVHKKELYKIGLLLPFYLEENDEIAMQQSGNVLEKKSIYPKSKFAIEFYNGFLQALDAISSDSCQFQVYVYDTKGKDSLRTKSLLQKEEFKSFDLIIGPLYYTNFERMADFAEKHQIPIVSPVQQNNKILLGNQYVFKSVSSKSSSVDQIATLVVDSFKTQNLLAIVDENSKEKTLVELYMKAYNKHLLNKQDTSIYSSIVPIRITTNYTLITTHLKKGKNNVIFVPSTNSTFITNLFNYLVNIINSKEYQDYQITLIGMEEWLNYESIDLEYFQQLNTYIPVNQHINYEDSLTNEFVVNYVASTKRYPSETAFLGNDIATYFGGYLNQFGTVFYNGSAIFSPSLLSTQLEFFKTGIESGYENTQSYILRFKDYQLVKAN